ncbi:MAG: hypothetical protein WB760_11510 [Xanthobacteraceae bacterium]
MLQRQIAWRQGCYAPERVRVPYQQMTSDLFAGNDGGDDVLGRWVLHAAA